MTEAHSIRAVLIVDDDELYLQSVTRRWSTLDLDITTATDLSTARQAARRRRPDLALIDLYLRTTGGMSSGIEVVRALRYEHSDTRIALISCQLSIVATEAAILAGACAVFDKYSTPAAILRRLADRHPSMEKCLETPTLESVEHEHIHRVIHDCHGNLSEAARRLGIFRSTLHRKLKRFAPRL